MECLRDARQQRQWTCKGLNFAGLSSLNIVSDSWAHGMTDFVLLLWKCAAYSWEQLADSSDHQSRAMC